jgi:oxaloacetate decarboxylase alpha subunit
VINVLMGERYKNITKETAGVLKGEYGTSPAPVNKELQAKVLGDGEKPITCRPADLIEPELDKLMAEFDGLAKEKGIRVADAKVDDVLIYALFPQIGLKFLENRDNPDAFEPVPGTEPAAPAAPAVAATSAPTASTGPEAYTVSVNGKSYNVTVSQGGAVQNVAPAAVAEAAPVASGTGEAVPAPLAGNVFEIKVAEGQSVNKGDVIMIVEAMKMETEVRTPTSGTVSSILVKKGDAVQVGETLMLVG